MEVARMLHRTPRRMLHGNCAATAWSWTGRGCGHSPASARTLPVHCPDAAGRLPGCCADATPDTAPDAAWTAAAIANSFANHRANFGANFSANIHRSLVRHFPPTARTRLGSCPDDSPDAARTLLGLQPYFLIRGWCLTKMTGFRIQESRQRFARLNTLN